LQLYSKTGMHCLIYTYNHCRSSLEVCHPLQPITSKIQSNSKHIYFILEKQVSIIILAHILCSCL
jgi:hypothetical protein